MAIRTTSSISSRRAPPTFYTTLGTTVEQSYVDHHPVFRTLIFGFFLALGDALGSQNAGLFIYSLFQCALTAFALGVSCCYLEHLGVPKVFRFVSVLFIALFPPIPQWATCMIKDALNAPFWDLSKFRRFCSCGCRVSRVSVCWKSNNDDMPIRTQ